MFFTSGGTEAVETAWKVAKQYFKLTGKPGKHKVISRAIAYHGTTQGALAITGLPKYKAPFEPVTPGGFRVPNTNFYRAPEPLRHRHQGLRAVGRRPDRRGDRIRRTRHRRRGVPRTGAERGRLASRRRPGYFERVREICDHYDVLLVSDEVICAFGRIGSMFACADFGYVPDMITCAKGMTSGYSPIGAMIASDRLFEPFNDGDTMFPHGYTFGGHPVSAAVALANLDIFEREGLNDRVKQQCSGVARHPGEALRPADRRRRPRRGVLLRRSNWSRTRRPSRPSTPTRKRALLRRVSSGAVRGRVVLPHRRSRRSVDPVAPPLISGQAEFDTIEAIVRGVLTRTGGLHEQTAASTRSGGNRRRRGRYPTPDFTAELHLVAVPGTAPEDVVADADGNIWTGVEDGRIVRISPDGGSVQVVADTGGRPLGLAVARDGRLLICDSHRGLLRYDPATGAIETLVAEVAGRKLTFCSNVVESSDGTIFFTESTSRFYYEYYKGSVIEGRPTGSLFRRDPDGTVSELAAGLYFANGVTLTADESALVSPRPPACRLSKYWLTGDRAGTITPLVTDSARLSRQHLDRSATAGSGWRWSPTATGSTNGWARARRSSAA